MPQATPPFVGRKQELDQWSTLLVHSAPEGQAVVVVGKYGMGKTWLLDQMIQQAQKSPSLQCFAARYVMAPGESPGMILRVILDDMFQAARYEAGTLDGEGKRFEQWLHIYRALGLFSQRSEADFHLLDQLRFDWRKNVFEQFVHRLTLFSHLLPHHARLLFVIDPELDTMSARVEFWTQVVKRLPPKVFLLFAQRYKDSLAINEEFQSQKNVHFIPSQEQQPQGLSDLTDDNTSQLYDLYSSKFQNQRIDRQAVIERFRQYRNHPYAVHAALNLLLESGFTDASQLPSESIPAAVCPLQWKGIMEHPLHEEAVRLFQAYAVLEVPTLDEMVCWVADISSEQLAAVLKDPFLSSMIRSESDGRLLYHHYLQAYVHSLLYTPDGTLTQEAAQLHQRAMKGYDDLKNRTIKPDPLVVVRLAEHALAVGGPALFAKTLCQCSDSFFALGFYQTYAALVDRALALISPLSTEAADLFLRLGELRQRQKEYKTSVKYYEDSLQTARKIGDPQRIAAALFGLGQVSLKREQFAEANMWLQDAVAYFEVGHNTIGLIEALILSAEVLWLQGETKKSEQMLNTALRTTEEVRNHRQRAKMSAAIYAAWGRLYDVSGNIVRSAEQYHKALDLTKYIYDQEAEAELQASMGIIFERIGNLSSAERHLTKAMSIHQDLKLLEYWAEDNVRLAHIAEMRGKSQSMNHYLEQARQVYQQLGNTQKLEELNGQ